MRGGFYVELIAMEPDLAPPCPIRRIDLDGEAEPWLIGIAQDREEAAEGIGVDRGKTGGEARAKVGIG